MTLSHVENIAHSSVGIVVKYVYTRLCSVYPVKWMPECPSVESATGWLFQHKLSSSLTEAERNEHTLTKFRKYESQGFADYMEGKKKASGEGAKEA